MNNDGFISKEEFQKVLGGVYMDDQAWAEFLEECDLDKDGKVNFLFFIFFLDFEKGVY